jgi:hypothetical protein
LIINGFFHFWAWKSNKVKSLLLLVKTCFNQNPPTSSTGGMFSWMLAKRMGKL